jgi:uncharacterized protein (TIGR02996 family)
MTHDEAFLQAIRADPASDAPRLIYADWLEEQGDPERTARAEFIRVQCRLFRLRPGERQNDLERRAEELLQANWTAWVGPLRDLVGPMRDRYGEGWLRETYTPSALSHFERGFVDRLTLSAERFLEKGSELARLTPLSHLGLWHAGRCARELARSPYLAGLTSLAFRDYHDAPLMAADAGALAASPYLEGLVHLDLHRNSIGDDGMTALAQAPWLTGLEVLDLVDNGLSTRGVAALASSPSLQRLGKLRLGNNLLQEFGAAILADAPFLGRLHTLSMPRCSLGDAGVEALVQFSDLAGLHTLGLENNNITDRGAFALARCEDFVELRTLLLQENPISYLGENALRQSPHLPHLTNLQIH